MAHLKNQVINEIFLVRTLLRRNAVLTHVPDPGVDLNLDLRDFYGLLTLDEDSVHLAPLLDDFADDLGVVALFETLEQREDPEVDEVVGEFVGVRDRLVQVAQEQKAFLVF